MPQYTSQTQQPSGIVVTTVFDTETDQVTYTVTTPTGQTATATKPASRVSNSSNVPTAELIAQLRAGGRTGGISIGGSLTDGTQDVKNQASLAEAQAKATNTAVPANPVPTVPLISTPAGGVPAVGENAAIASGEVVTSPIITPTITATPLPPQNTGTGFGDDQQEFTTDSLGNSFKTVDGEAVLFRAAETDDTYYTDPANSNVYRDGNLFRAEDVQTEGEITTDSLGNSFKTVDGEAVLFRAAETDDTYYTDPADGNVYRDGNLFRAAEVDDTYYTDPADGNVYRDGALYRAEDVQTEGEITTDSLGNSYKTIDGEAVLYRAAEVDETVTGTGFGDDQEEYTTDSRGNTFKNGTLYRAAEVDEDAVAGAEKGATLTKAQEQRTLQQRYKQPGNQDWRVRLVLAEGANYLYKDTANQLLKPLMNANGVIFPYTPSIAVNYTANYDNTDLTHSNYRGYFYKSSVVGEVTITATFTAQDTAEAQYLLAVIHFFKSVTKMFYGQDAQRGAPPPLLYLVGLGEFQFNGHPCVVKNFQYTLPTDVDYIRASSPNNYGINLLNRRTATTTPSNPISSVLNRLQNAGLFPGANPKTTTPNPGPTTGTVNNTQRPTYVPTKMDMTIQLLPLQTRSQVSQQFSVKEFANGNLLKGGFW
jgi:hypothetical protein